MPTNKQLMVHLQVLGDSIYLPRKIGIVDRLITSHIDMAVTSDAFLQMYTYKQKNTFQYKIYITVVPEDEGQIIFIVFQLFC